MADPWREALDRHDSNADAHPRARRAGLEAFERQRQQVDADLWGAIGTLRRDVDTLKLWRAGIVGGLAVLTVEVTVFGGVLLAHFLK